MSTIPLGNFPPLSPQPSLVIFPPVSRENQTNVPHFPPLPQPPPPPKLPASLLNNASDQNLKVFYPPMPPKPSSSPLPRPDCNKKYKLYLNSSDQNTNDISSNASYRDIFENLRKLNATQKQLNIWANTYNKLDENDLPTYQFSKGFIDLLKAGATDIALQTYSVGAEQIATKHSGKRSLKKLIEKCLDIIQRPNLSETQRESLLIKSVYSLLKKDGISFKSFINLLANAIGLLSKLL